MLRTQTAMDRSSTGVSINDEAIGIKSLLQVNIVSPPNAVDR